MPIRRLDPCSLMANEDWVENIVAFTCPACGSVFVVSEALHPQGRPCPSCLGARGHVVGRRDGFGIAEVRWGDDFTRDKPRLPTSEEFQAEERRALLGELARVLNDPDSEAHAELFPDAIPVRRLEAAVLCGNVALAAALLRAGTDANEPSALFGTVLHAAARLGDREMVRLLRGHGADPGHTNPAGLTAADVAEAAGHLSIAADLREGSGRAPGR